MDMDSSKSEMNSWLPPPFPSSDQFTVHIEKDRGNLYTTSNEAPSSIDQEQDTVTLTSSSASSSEVHDNIRMMEGSQGSKIIYVMGCRHDLFRVTHKLSWYKLL